MGFDPRPSPGFDDRRPDLVQETLVQVTSYAALDRPGPGTGVSGHGLEGHVGKNFWGLQKCRLHFSFFILRLQVFMEENQTKGRLLGAELAGGCLLVFPLRLGPQAKSSCASCASTRLGSTSSTAASSTGTPAKAPLA